MTKESGNPTDPYVRFARTAVHAWVRERKKIDWVEYAAENEVDPAFSERMTGPGCGAFVSLHRQGLLRGCIGTIEPVRSTLAEELASNAVSACSRDPRFPPVLPDELENLSIKVDLLQPPVPYEGAIDWDVRRFGVVVAGRGGRRGILLPDLEGVDHAHDQLDIATQKAGLRGSEVERIWLFEVSRHS